MKNPIIGISLFSDSEKVVNSKLNYYIDAIRDFGGIPIIFPVLKDEEKIEISRGRKTESTDTAEPIGKELSEADKLREEMQKAISEENFERAAELRDKIKELEKEGGENE